MLKEPLMELIKDRAFEFTVLGVDYVAYHHQPNDMFRGKTRIYELDDGGDTPTLEFGEIVEKPACEAAMFGYKSGLKQGEAIGAAGVKRALRQLLDLPSLEDVEALDGRMDRVAQGAAR